jgi:hypothetical protein
MTMPLFIRPDFLEIERKSFERPSHEQLELTLNEAPERFARAAAKAVEKRGPSYKTPVFKCLEDFEKCKKHNSRSLCMALFSICVGKQLIPFTK